MCSAFAVLLLLLHKGSKTLDVFSRFSKKKLEVANNVPIEVRDEEGHR